MGKIIEIKNLSKWIEFHNKKFEKSILISKCYKWTRWQEDNSIHIFPCVCPTRNTECIFMETYYEVQKIHKLIQREQEYIEALEQYNKIKHNKNAVFEWVKNNEKLGVELLHFSSIIKIKIQQEPYELKQVGLAENELQYLLKFKEIFTEYYYSEEYENY